MRNTKLLGQKSKLIIRSIYRWVKILFIEFVLTTATDIDMLLQV